MNYIIMPGLKYRDGVKLGINPNEVMTAVCSYYNISMDILTGQDRTKDIIEARHIAMYTIRKHCKKGTIYIGKLFNRDHTSVVHACQKVKNLMETEIAFKNDVQNIFSTI